MYDADFKQFMKYSYSSCSKDNFKSLKVFFYIYIIFFLYLRNANKYYQKYKEKLRKKRERYQNLSEEEKKQK